MYFLGLLCQQYALVYVSQADLGGQTVFFNVSKEELLEGEQFSFNCKPPENFGITEQSCTIYKLVNVASMMIFTNACNSQQVTFVARCQEGALQLSKDAFVAADSGRYCYKPEY